jgi:hypothetical protein
MLHITCDHCGRSVEEGEARFVVRVEVFAAHEPVAGTDADLDVDPMEAVSQSLEASEEAGYPEAAGFAAQELRFDLCQGCRTRYLRDPLGKENGQKLHFSEN